MRSLGTVHLQHMSYNTVLHRGRVLCFSQKNAALVIGVLQLSQNFISSSHQTSIYCGVEDDTRISACSLNGNRVLLLAARDSGIFALLLDIQDGPLRRDSTRASNLSVRGGEPCHEGLFVSFLQAGTVLLQSHSETVLRIGRIENGEMRVIRLPPLFGSGKSLSAPVLRLSSGKLVAVLPGNPSGSVIQMRVDANLSYEPLGDLPQFGRRVSQAAVVGDRFLVGMGGWQTGRSWNLRVFDLQTNRSSAARSGEGWPAAAPCACLMVQGDALYLFGGRGFHEVRFIPLLALVDLIEDEGIRTAFQVAALQHRVSTLEAALKAAREEHASFCELVRARANSIESAPSEGDPGLLRVEEKVSRSANATPSLGDLRGSGVAQGGIAPTRASEPAGRGSEPVGKHVVSRVISRTGGLAGARSSALVKSDSLLPDIPVVQSQKGAQGEAGRATASPDVRQREAVELGDSGAAASRDAEVVPGALLIPVRVLPVVPGVFLADSAARKSLRRSSGNCAKGAPKHSASRDGGISAPGDPARSSAHRSVGHRLCAYSQMGPRETLASQVLGALKPGVLIPAGALRGLGAVRFRSETRLSADGKGPVDSLALESLHRNSCTLRPALLASRLAAQVAWKPTRGGTKTPETRITPLLIAALQRLWQSRGDK